MLVGPEEGTPEAPLLLVVELTVVGLTVGQVMSDVEPKRWDPIGTNVMDLRRKSHPPKDELLKANQLWPCSTSRPSRLHGTRLMHCWPSCSTGN